jgi:hypothetical protein
MKRVRRCGVEVGVEVQVPCFSPALLYCCWCEDEGSSANAKALDHFEPR